MKRSTRKVSFNNVVTVANIPCKEEEWVDGPRTMTLAESMRIIVRKMKILGIDLKNDTVENGLGGGEDDVIKRMVVSSYTETLSKIIYDHPSVKKVDINIDMDEIKYDNASLRDKITLDFLNSLIRGISSKNHYTSDIPGETLYILLNPSPEDFIGDMGHCFVVHTEAYSKQGYIPSVQMTLDLRMDR